MSIKHVIIVILVLMIFSCDENLEKQLDEAIIDISGKVTDNGQAVEGALVLLIESVDVNEGLSLANGSITDGSGNYIIINADAGNYYVLAVEDHNGNMEFDAESDRVGFYIHNTIGPTQITVSDQDLEDIDIVNLYSL